eukprot:1143016-Ditylum_brightwellii.AAC.1
MKTREWNACVIKQNYSLESFLVPYGVKAENFALDKLLDILDNGVPTSWNYNFNKEGVYASSAMLQEFIEICVCLEESRHNMSIMKKKKNCDTNFNKDEYILKRKAQQKLFYLYQLFF